MDCVTTIFGIICENLWTPFATRFQYLYTLEENVDSLLEETSDLKAQREDVKRRVEIDERKQLTCTQQVERWLQKAEAINGKVGEIERDFQRSRRCLGDSFPDCCESYKLGKRVADTLEDVRTLKTGGIFENVTLKPVPKSVNVIPYPPTVGTNSTFEKVQSCLKEDDVRVIGIWGMGGVGKTTLLKKINNELGGDFDVVIWVLVSHEFSVEKIRQEIGMSLGLGQDLTASDISNALSSKKFLLLLDDVWRRLDLEAVGIPYPNNQNKFQVILTTRSKQVCGQMDATRNIKVEPLKWEDAWNLFLEKVGEDAIKSHPDILMLAQDVAKECQGLPLALITIGRAMATKTTPEEWEHAKTVLRKSASDFSGMEEVFPLLKFSYDNLHDDTTRSCFLFCSLYPEDRNIETNRLIEYWMGEGIIDEYDDIEEARNNGHDLIGRLKVACMLEEGYNQYHVKMHDIIRDLALWIASEFGRKKKNKFVVQASIHLEDAPGVERWEEAERALVERCEFKELTGTPTCPHLLTLIIKWNRKLYKISNTFFQFMPVLRVLDLSQTGLTELPTGIEKLVELQYLNLSWTEIKALPREVGNLIKLKQLNLTCTFRLKTIPHELISGLPKLQVLDIYESHYDAWKVEGCGDDGSGVDLAELECLRNLIDLSINISSDTVLNKFLESRILPKCTRKLRIMNEVSRFELSSTFWNMKNLRELHFCLCLNLEELIIEAEVENKDRWLVPRGFLKNLRVLRIDCCFKLRNITWIVHLQSLEEITLAYCNEMEEIIGGREAEEESQSTVLPNLRSIGIWNLPKLKSICRQTSAFPSLKKLTVHACPKLKKLSLGSAMGNNTTSLRIYGDDKEWWDGLEWEEEAMKSTFRRCFTERSKAITQSSPPTYRVLATVNGPIQIHNFTVYRHSDWSPASNLDWSPGSNPDLSPGSILDWSPGSISHVPLTLI